MEPDTKRQDTKIPIESPISSKGSLSAVGFPESGLRSWVEALCGYEEYGNNPRPDSGDQTEGQLIYEALA